MEGNARSRTAGTSNRRNRTASTRAAHRNMGGRSYVDGTAVRMLRIEDGRERQVKTRVHHEVSQTTRKNREKATRMNVRYVIFLVAVCVAILLCSVRFLRLRSEVIMRMEDVAVMESRLSQLKENNDALYSSVLSSVDLNSIKKEALGRLGMKYPSDDQIQTYETSRNSYVRQYQDVPDTK